jgi:hypothetical protein
MKNVIYRPGEYFVYKNGDSYEIGKVFKPAGNDAYFCFYSSGETAAKTPVSVMHKLVNNYCIIDTNLGGNRGKQVNW